jgi:multiple sugar transport system substrate-binding protein
MAMEEIELSVMSYGPTVEHLQSVLQAFEAQYRVRVKIQPLDWERGWADIIKLALYGHGPVVSEVGSTWVASLASMAVLRPFATREIAELGGSAPFLPALWQAGQTPGDQAVWAIPWLAETRVIFYWRKMLQAVGLEEQTAFQSQAQLEQTLERLRTNSAVIPWVVPTQTTLNTLHQAASWLWGAGGHFLDSARRQVTFHQPAARVGLRDYYRLGRFLSSQAASFSDEQASTLFLEGQAAITLNGPWLLPPLDSATPFWDDVGLALPPGVPVVSGSHLVLWKHIAPRQEKLAMNLVRFLTSQPVQMLTSQNAGLLPVKVQVLAEPPFTDRLLYPVLRQSLQTGRTFPSMRLWGLIEEKLSAALGQVWAKVLAEPEADLDDILRVELEALALRLNTTLDSGRNR